MDSDTRLGNTCINSLLPRFKSGESREKRRMDIEHCPGVGLEQRLFHKTHEASQAHKIHARILQSHRRIRLNLLRKFHAERRAVNHTIRDTVFRGTLKYVGLGII